ncbi:MAG: sugar phosphate isomerase/epimerase [Oscillospiraceae bacterium]|nr:sugar phosphate isomerase/epimerase [Oscillospiraceae bacterium]
MTNFIDKLYISTVAENAAELAKKHGLGLEIAEFCTAYNMDNDFETWDLLVREHMKKTNRFTFHAPLNELCPAAIDPMIVEVAMKRFNQAYELMRGYGINTMIVHSGNLPILYNINWFIEHSIPFWKEFLSDKPEDLRLCIENLFETGPSPIVDIVNAVNDERFRLCLDLGHAEIFREDITLLQWTNDVAHLVSHVHLHNNDGINDSHSAANDGIIDLAPIIKTLTDKAPQATYTIESIDAESTIKWLIDENFI